MAWSLEDCLLYSHRLVVIASVEKTESDIE
jgi:hypothetical protein